MSTDFRDAAIRHLLDGHLLQAEGRWANADHLFGVSAECSLKAIMVGLGHPTTRRGAPRDHQEHIDALLPNFEVLANGLLDAKHLAMMPATGTFRQWSVHQRYWPRADARFTAANVADLATGAQQCHNVLNELVLDGIL